MEPSEHISEQKKQWGKLSSNNFTVVAVFPKTCIKQASFNGKFYYNKSMSSKYNYLTILHLLMLRRHRMLQYNNQFIINANIVNIVKFELN